MNKIVWLSLMALCLPLVGSAQNNDDLYFTPKKKDHTATEKRENAGMTNNSSSVYVNPGTTIVIKDVKGNERDVDEYNRRYTSYDNDFEMEGDTLVIKEKQYADRGEWVNGFDGTEDEYEYAMRLIRFRNPRFAVPVSSPLYWDIVYGSGAWDWNVYDDGFYAYAFPTFSNNLWFDWRFGNFGMSWGINYPYYSWGGYYPGYWGSSWYWGHHHHHHGWYDPWYGGGSWGRPYYYDNRPVRYTQSRPSGSSVRPTLNTRPGSNDYRPGSGASRPSTGHVVNSRPTGSSVRPGSVNTSGVGSRPGYASGGVSSRPSGSAGTTRPTTSGTTGVGSSRPVYSRPSGEVTTRPSTSYSRPSSTRSSGYNNNRPSGGSYGRESGTTRPSGTSGTYRNSERSNYSNSNSSRSSSSRSSVGSYSGGSRSSGGSYSGGGGSSSGSGGGSSRGGRR